MFYPSPEPFTLMSVVQVKIWFQNRRMKLKKERQQLTETYSRSKKDIIKSGLLGSVCNVGNGSVGSFGLSEEAEPSGMLGCPEARCCPAAEEGYEEDEDEDEEEETEEMCESLRASPADLILHRHTPRVRLSSANVSEADK
ncbi:unnamed protein product [Protopolystoma xenopodis]|uniref:Homeobox domain-containing protein n=1 Tax=Protopolystoma xenopodis TaxID=117903 RepID=A0A448X228_9PLAT|nr:unnamed protein product [Protopolystoma xenopodis]